MFKQEVIKKQIKYQHYRLFLCWLAYQYIYNSMLLNLPQIFETHIFFQRFWSSRSIWIQPSCLWDREMQLVRKRVAIFGVVLWWSLGYTQSSVCSGVVGNLGQKKTGRRLQEDTCTPGSCLQRKGQVHNNSSFMHLNIATAMAPYIMHQSQRRFPQSN